MKKIVNQKRLELGGGKHDAFVIIAEAGHLEMIRERTEVVSASAPTQSN